VEKTAKNKELQLKNKELKTKKNKLLRRNMQTYYAYLCTNSHSF